MMSKEKELKKRLRLLQKARNSMDGNNIIMFADGDSYNVGHHHSGFGHMRQAKNVIEAGPRPGRAQMVYDDDVCRFSSFNGHFGIECGRKLSAKQEECAKELVIEYGFTGDRLTIDLHGDPDEEWLRRRLERAAPSRNE